ncbi:MAG: hypothetical protein H6626_12630 [Pseudobdellovibrionaceae bacterium]|nr:MAG: hypothetical protein H6626_12630 [Pseudobdellovibrionaceae bacterium]
MSSYKNGTLPKNRALLPMMGQQIVVIALSAAVLSCQLADNRISGRIHDSGVSQNPSLPTVTVGAPTPASGDATTTFDFPVTYLDSTSNNLTVAKVQVNATGSVSCATPSIAAPTTPTPTVSLTSCTGSGTVDITILAATSENSNQEPDTGSSASPTATVTNAPTCPTGYILVPALADYTTEDFCVMKYEAKVQIDVGGVIHDWGCDTDTTPTTGNGTCTGVSDNWVEVVPQASTPVSVPEGRPWREIDRDHAIDECRSLNSESAELDRDNDVNTDGTYDLITNDEWQTIARNIEQVASNWEENKVGGASTGYTGTDNNQLNHGHADSTPNEPLMADGDDTNACIGTGQEVSATIDDSCPGTGAGWSPEKRTHTLSNSEVIWDLAGNVWEWVKDNNSNAYGSDNYFSLITDLTHLNLYSLSGGTTNTARTAKNQFGPLYDYTSLTTGNRGGLGYGYVNSSAGAVLRGGYWNVITFSGVFAASLYYGPASSFNGIGFRCRFSPP